MNKILALEPPQELFKVQTVDAFENNTECMLTLQADGREEDIIYPFFFSAADEEYFWRFEKKYLAGLRPGTKTPCWTYLRRKSECYIVCEPGAEGFIVDKFGNVSNSTGPMYRHIHSNIICYDNGNVSIDNRHFKNAIEISEPVIIFYDEHLKNYYHWWIESLLRLNLTSNILGLSPRALAPAARANVRSWRGASLPIIDRTVIYPNIDGPHLIKVPEAIWCGNYVIFNTPQYAFRHLAETVRLRHISAKSSSIGVFIVRGTSRQFSNFDQIITLMSQLGIDIKSFDSADQLEEIDYFRSCKIIIGVQGAGLSNMLFANPGTAILELMPSAEVRDHFWLLASKLGHRYGTIICQSEGQTNDSNLFVNIDVLKMAICKMLDFSSYTSPR